MQLKKIFAGMLTAVMVVPVFAINTFATEPDTAPGGSVCPLTLSDDTYIKSQDIRNYIYTNYDTNKDWSLDRTELESVVEVTSNSAAVTTIAGIEYLPNLNEVEFSGCTGLTTSDFSQCTSLVKISCRNTGLTQITFGTNENLSIVNLDGSPITTVDLSGCTNLSQFYASNTNIKDINFGRNEVLSRVDLNTTKLTRLDLTGCPNIRALDIRGNDGRIQKLNLINNQALNEAYINGTVYPYMINGKQAFLTVLEPNNFIGRDASTQVVNQMTEGSIVIDLFHFPDPELKKIIENRYDSDGDLVLSDIDIENVTSIVISFNDKINSLAGINVFTNLKHLQCVCCENLVYVYLGGLENLESAILYRTSLFDVDISECPNLKYLDVGVTNVSRIDISNNPYLLAAMNGEMTEKHGDDYDYYEYEDADGNFISFDCDAEVFDGTVTPTPTTTVAPTTQPTVAPTTPTTPATPAPESGVSGFVERLYTIALDRPSDPNGKADWVNRVYTQGATGADIAAGFLFSPEFLGKNMSNSDFLAVLYRVFFDRAGDQGGINYWLDNMANGMDKQTVIWGFINSTEWANVCLRYGIASGGNGVPSITIEPSAEIIDFATRLYTTCLCRPADNTGLNDWATRLANRQISGSEAAAGFFFSAEFVNDSSIDNAEYINRLYQTFMGRAADQGGFDDWMNRMNNGATREDVFNGFAGSQEWAGICSSYGILK